MTPVSKFAFVSVGTIPVLNELFAKLEFFFGNKSRGSNLSNLARGIWRLSRRGVKFSAVFEDLPSWLISIVSNHYWWNIPFFFYIVHRKRVGFLFLLKYSSIVAEIMIKRSSSENIFHRKTLLLYLWCAYGLRFSSYGPLLGQLFFFASSNLSFFAVICYKSSANMRFVWASDCPFEKQSILCLHGKTTAGRDYHVFGRLLIQSLFSQDQLWAKPSIRIVLIFTCHTFWSLRKF